MLNNFLFKLTGLYWRNWILLIFDSYLIINAFILSYFIRFNFTFNFDGSQMVYQIPLVLLVSVFGFIITGNYKRIIRHSGIHDIYGIFLSCLISYLTLAGLIVLNARFGIFPDFTIPLSILTISLMLNIIFLITTRFVIKEVYNKLILRPNNTLGKIGLIYGAGEAGVILLSTLRKNKTNPIKIIGFVDDDRKKWNVTIDGVKVYNPDFIDKNFIMNNKISTIVISMQKIKPKRMIEITNMFSNYDLDILVVPPVNSWIHGNLNRNQIKSIRIEDLLGRSPLKLMPDKLIKYFNSKVIIVTGAAGSIGSEMVRQLCGYDIKELILIDQSESELYNLEQFLLNSGISNIKSIIADIRNPKRMESIFQIYKPNIIFHAAAYKHVPLMEESPYEAVSTNIYGTKVVSDLSVKYEVEKFVMVSTDKAVNPTSVMGASKRIAEMYINCLEVGRTKFMTTRFGNVLGSNGSVIPLFKKQIELGGPITVTHKDITRFFMTIPEACQLVLEASCIGFGGQIYIFDMGNSIKIYDLALNMIKLSGLKYPDDIDIKITGLRPGEKIYEELLANDEFKQKPLVDHYKISIAKARKLDKELTRNNIDKLLNYNNKLNSVKTVSMMKEIVPEYKSNNSIFESLDTDNI